jgi:hypothetical protein
MLERTAGAIDKLEQAVEQSLRTQQTMMARMEATPCLMASSLSKESTERLKAARRAALSETQKSAPE